MKTIENLKKVPKEYFILGIVMVLIAVVILNGLRKSKTAESTAVSASGTLFQNNLIEKEEGNISVEVQYLPDKSNGNTMSFDIALNNHAVSLDSFDFQKSVVLEKDDKSSYPTTVAAEGEGHHRRATVTFTKVPMPFTVAVLYLNGIKRRDFTFNTVK